MSQIRREEYVNTTPDTVRDEHVQVVRDPYAERRMGAYRLQQILYTILTLIEGLLVIRFALKLFAANPGAGFASLIYGLTEPLVAPFLGLFGTPSAANGSVLELHTLVALIVYPLIFWVLGRLIRLAFADNRTGVVTQRVDSYAEEPTVTQQRVTRQVVTNPEDPAYRGENRVTRTEEVRNVPPPPPDDPNL